MLAEIATELDAGGVTVTWGMMIAALPVAFVIELVKVVLDRVAGGWREIQKSLLPLLSIGITAGLFRIAGIHDWMFGGILVGLSAGGGYDFVKGVKVRIGNPPNFASILAVVVLTSLLLPGCGNVWMAPDYQAQFVQFDDSAHVWLERCQNDPNTCEQGLSSMVEELDVWVGIINNIDPEIAQ